MSTRGLSGFTLNSRVKMVTPARSDLNRPGPTRGPRGVWVSGPHDRPVEHWAGPAPLSSLSNPEKGRKSEGGRARGRGLIPSSPGTTRRVRRGRGRARTPTPASSGPPPPAYSGAPAAEGTERAGGSHLVLLLAPEAQACRPLLEALAVIGPRLVGLELHHRGGLLLPLLLQPPPRGPGRRHPAGELGRGRVGAQGRREARRRRGEWQRGRSVPEPAAASTWGRTQAPVTAARVLERKHRLCPGVRRSPWSPPPARLRSLLLLLLLLATPPPPPPPPGEERGARLAPQGDSCENSRPLNSNAAAASHRPYRPYI